MQGLKFGDPLADDIACKIKDAERYLPDSDPNEASVIRCGFRWLCNKVLWLSLSKVLGWCPLGFCLHRMIPFALDPYNPARWAIDDQKEGEKDRLCCSACCCEKCSCCTAGDEEDSKDLWPDKEVDYDQHPHKIRGRENSLFCSAGDAKKDSLCCSACCCGKCSCCTAGDEEDSKETWPNKAVNYDRHPHKITGRENSLCCSSACSCFACCSGTCGCCITPIVLLTLIPYFIALLWSPSLDQCCTFCRTHHCEGVNNILNTTTPEVGCSGMIQFPPLVIR